MSTLTAVGLSLAVLFEQCAPDISPVTLEAIVQTESSGNPFVVANVSDGTSHLFNSQSDATRFVNTLSQQNKKFSAGLMQIYSANFTALEIDNITVFDPCTNIKAGAKILTENYNSIKEGDDIEKLKQSLSMYYSGNKTRGFKKEPAFSNTSYIERIEKKAYKIPSIVPIPEIPPINQPVNNEPKQDIPAWDVFGDFVNVK